MNAVSCPAYCQRYYLKHPSPHLDLDALRCSSETRETCPPNTVTSSSMFLPCPAASVAVNRRRRRHLISGPAAEWVSLNKNVLLQLVERIIDCHSSGGIVAGSTGSRNMAAETIVVGQKTSESDDVDVMTPSPPPRRHDSDDRDDDYDAVAMETMRAPVGRPPPRLQRTMSFPSSEPGAAGRQRHIVRAQRHFRRHSDAEYSRQLCSPAAMSAPGRSSTADVECLNDDRHRDVMRLNFTQGIMFCSTILLRNEFSRLRLAVADSLYQDHWRRQRMKLGAGRCS